MCFDRWHEESLRGRGVPNLDRYATSRYGAPFSNVFSVSIIACWLTFRTPSCPPIQVNNQVQHESKGESHDEHLGRAVCSGKSSLISNRHHAQQREAKECYPDTNRDSITQPDENTFGVNIDRFIERLQKQADRNRFVSFSAATTACDQICCSNSSDCFTRSFMMLMLRGCTRIAVYGGVVWQSPTDAVQAIADFVGMLC